MAQQLLLSDKLHHCSLLGSWSAALVNQLWRCPHAPPSPRPLTPAGGAVRRRRSSSTTLYHEFVSQEMKRLKATHPDLDQTTAFQVAASSK